MDYSMMWNGVGWFGGISMMFSWVIILAGIVLFVVWTKISRKGGGGASNAPESALDILKRRYASGEITKEQYESMRLDLER
ncbi:MAG: SHOCT domain-containing protein [Syntrophobacteraceae bacterium]